MNKPNKKTLKIATIVAAIPFLSTVANAYVVADPTLSLDYVDENDSMEAPLGDTSFPVANIGFGIHYLGNGWCVKAEHAGSGHLVRRNPDGSTDQINGDWNNRLYVERASNTLWNVDQITERYDGDFRLPFATWRDLIFIRLKEDPRLPEMEIYGGNPVGREILFYGFNHYLNSYHPGSSNLFRTTSGGDSVKRWNWGTNVIEGAGNNSVWTIMDAPAEGGLLFEANAIGGDSSSGAYTKHNGKWKILGITVSPGWSTGLFNYGNRTGMEDLTNLKGRVDNLIANSPALPLGPAIPGGSPQPNPVPTGGSIEGRFFNDNDSNNKESSGDTGVSGATVQLRTSNGATVASTTTNNNGIYKFNNVDSDWYKVRFIKPSGTAFVTKGVGNDSVKSDASTSTGETGAYQVFSSAITNVDAGLVGSADPDPPSGGGSIGGRFFVDNDSSNTESSGDTGVSGATVQLRTTSGVTVATKTTSSNGNYNFTNLASDWYKIKFIKPSGKTFVKKGVGNDSVKSDASTSTGETGAYQVFSSAITNVDAGIKGGGSSPATTTNKASGRFYIDNDGNNKQSTGDGNVVGRTVQLLKGSTVVETTTTDGSGKYSFIGFSNGYHKLRFLRPGGTSFVTGNVGDNDSVDSDVWDTAGGYTSGINYTGNTRLDIDAGIND